MVVMTYVLLRWKIVTSVRTGLSRGCNDAFACPLTYSVVDVVGSNVVG